MRYDIHYSTNDQLWSMESAAEKAGYKKTEDCYWVQIFINGENYIVTTREDAADIIGDPVKHFNALLTVTGDPAAEQPTIKEEEKKMSDYNYLEAVTADVLDYIREEVNFSDFDTIEELEEKLNDELWICDSVTGNASGSYTFNTWKAEEYLAHNWDLLSEALRELCCSGTHALEMGAEYCDVTIRCYLLGQAISAALEEIEEEFTTSKEEE